MIRRLPQPRLVDLSGVGIHKMEDVLSYPRVWRPIGRTVVEVVRPFKMRPIRAIENALDIKRALVIIASTYLNQQGSTQVGVSNREAMVSS
jgi:hypothetical protein